MMQADPPITTLGHDADTCECEGDAALRPMCPVARSILDSVVARLAWSNRQRSQVDVPRSAVVGDELS